MSDFDFTPPAEPRKSRYKRPGSSAGSSPALPFILAGTACALLSVPFWPLGLAGLIFGVFALVHRSTLGGMAVVVLSILCSAIGAAAATRHY